ncbi:YmfL family putative regulatory protein [Caballeronia sp. EK]|uniref:YmfL family putative regulatory protein n=1 Tax=Caballeronia sp. EK TaxID=2767469 RepID=UPI0021066F06|nr:YmfL family putative regulatory protein [Caballeronia sp. EK]
MNITDAAYAVVHDYPGGTESLAPRLGMSAAVLRNKVNPNNTTHHITLAEAVRTTDITGDERILTAWAVDRNAVVVHLPEPSSEPDNEELLEKFLKLTSHYGALAKRHQEATQDGEVDDEEMADLRRIGNAIHQTVEEINALTARIYTRGKGPRVEPKIVRARTA